MSDTLLTRRGGSKNPDARAAARRRLPEQALHHGRRTSQGARGPGPPSLIVALKGMHGATSAQRTMSAGLPTSHGLAEQDPFPVRHRRG